MLLGYQLPDAAWAMWVAGAFTVDGLGGPFVSRIEGDHHNVVGLSLPLLRILLLELGIAWPRLWRTTSTDACH